MVPRKHRQGIGADLVGRVASGPTYRCGGKRQVCHLEAPIKTPHGNGIMLQELKEVNTAEAKCHKKCPAIPEQWTGNATVTNSSVLAGLPSWLINPKYFCMSHAMHAYAIAVNRLALPLFPGIQEVRVLHG